MALTDILRERAALSGRTAQVECGELGRLTVEALPVREIELLLRESDGPRKVFYAACRELQRSGEELRKAGQLYQPDGILQFVSDSEAELAVRTVLELSGWQEGAQRSEFHAGANPDSRSGNHSDEIRLSSVQNSEKDFSEVRPDPVHSSGSADAESGSRPEFVQFFSEQIPELGQDSHETQPRKTGRPKGAEADTKAQAMGDFSSGEAQNVVSEFPGDGTWGRETAGGTGAMHENESEFSEGRQRGLHENESDFVRKFSENLHEIKSPFQGSLHETKTDFAGIGPESMHEIMSDFGENPHEIKSDFRGTVHEIRSESPAGLHEIKSELQKILHESESELGERMARQLLEGLRRAKWVRGG